MVGGGGCGNYEWLFGSTPLDIVMKEEKIFEYQNLFKVCTICECILKPLTWKDIIMSCQKVFTRGRRWMGWTMVVVVVLVVEVGVWFTSPSVCLSVCLYFRKIRSFRLFYCSFPVSLPQWQITFSCLWHQSTGLMGSNLITCPFDCLSSIFPCFTWPLLKIGSNESIVWSRP